MDNDKIVAIIFIFLVMILCKVYNFLVMRYLKKLKSIKNDKLFIDEHQIDGLDGLALVGTGNDTNSDYEFIKAVNEIVMSENIRVKLYD